MRNNLNVCVLNTLQFARQLANAVARNPPSLHDVKRIRFTVLTKFTAYFSKNISVDFIQNLQNI